MRIQYTASSARTLARPQPAVRKALYKQLGFLLANLNHPSLRAKKYDEPGDLWQARVNRDWRFYFRIESDTYILVDVVPHPK